MRQADDAVERGADLVTHRSQEALLGMGGFIAFAACIGHGGFGFHALGHIHRQTNGTLPFAADAEHGPIVHLKGAAAATAHHAEGLAMQGAGKIGLPFA